MKKPKSGAKGAPQPGHGTGTGGTAAHKPAHKHKPAHVPASVRAARHKAALKAARTRAKNAKKAKKHPHRKLALADGVACCAAEALAASLRLAGHQVDEGDVLALYWSTATHLDEGASIEVTLLAAMTNGLAGVRLADFRPAAETAPGVVIGVTLPGGPHALTLDPSGLVWSWGELYDPAELGAGLIEEAWLVDWEV